MSHFLAQFCVCLLSSHFIRLLISSPCIPPQRDTPNCVASYERALTLAPSDPLQYLNACASLLRAGDASDKVAKYYKAFCQRYAPTHVILSCFHFTSFYLIVSHLDDLRVFPSTSILLSLTHSLTLFTHSLTQMVPSPRRPRSLDAAQRSGPRSRPRRRPRQRPVPHRWPVSSSTTSANGLPLAHR